MHVIGLTGGVGSGKTAAAHMLAELLDAELLIADELGHVAMEKGTEGYRRILDSFGTGILNEQGQIVREKLSGLAFADAEALKRLNRIIHPAVKEYLRDYIDRRKKEAGWLILETAIMFETGCDALCDEVWYVYVSPELRKERLAAGRGYSEEKTDAIMQKQMSEEEYRKRCRYVIENEEDEQSLKEKLSCLAEKAVRELC